MAAGLRRAKVLG